MEDKHGSLSHEGHKHRSEMQKMSAVCVSCRDFLDLLAHGPEDLLRFGICEGLGLQDANLWARTVPNCLAMGFGFQATFLNIFFRSSKGRMGKRHS